MYITPFLDETVTNIIKNALLFHNLLKLIKQYKNEEWICSHDQ